VSLFHSTVYRELFRLPEDVDISLTFGCKEPMSGSHLKLEGMGAFDAAVHCASVAAAERQQKIKKSYSTGNLGSTPALSGPDGMPRSASINNMPGGSPRSGNSPTSISAAAAAMSPSTPPSAAGASAATLAAQDRRQAFPAQQQPQQPSRHQQQPSNVRSRSFSAFTSSGPRSTGVEPPAAFRSILGMLNNTLQAPQGAAAAGGAGSAPFSGACPAPLPQASPRGSRPPPSPVSGQSAAAAAAQQQTRQQAAAAAAAALKRDRLSLRQISELKDVPEVDETVAVGSLSGKFKLTLKAFSRKVARSLSFNSKSAGGAAAVSASCGGSMASMGSVEDLPAFAARAGSAAGSFSVTSDSSSRVASYSAASAEAPRSLVVPPAALNRGTSPLPPATPPGIYTC